MIGPSQASALACATLISWVLALSACQKGDHPPTDWTSIKVGAASDLAFAFKDIGNAFAAAEKVQPPTFSFGSTGQLARQIAEGAPFDLFAAANVSFVDDVTRAGACDPTTKALYARGRIVLWTRRSPGFLPPKSLADLKGPRFVRIAIANPEHAPYGKAAKQALQAAGLWQDLEKRMVYGENVQQALQFAQTGNVEAAIVALSLSIVAKDGNAWLIDPALHSPIDQALVVCRNGPSAPTARAFAQLVSSPEGQAIMKRYGFLPPGETLAREGH